MLSNEEKFPIPRNAEAGTSQYIGAVPAGFTLGADKRSWRGATGTREDDSGRTRRIRIYSRLFFISTLVAMAVSVSGNYFSSFSYLGSGVIVASVVMDSQLWMIIRIISYTIIVPGTFYLALWEWNERHPMRATLFSLYGIYMLMLSATIVLELLGILVSSTIRFLLTPLVFLMAITMISIIVRHLRRSST